MENSHHHISAWKKIELDSVSKQPQSTSYMSMRYWLEVQPFQLQRQAAQAFHSQRALGHTKHCQLRSDCSKNHAT